MAVVRSLQHLNPLLSHRLPVSAALVAGVILFILVAVGVSFAASATPVISQSTSPFAAYATIMPGQPLSALEAFNCGAAFANNTAMSVFYCMIRPKDGPISSISVNGEKGKIESLTIRTSDVRVGDLIEYWGHPDLTRVFQRSFTLAWDEGIYVIGSVQGRFNYWSHANYVLVMALEHRP
jgi:hypothetical protein